MKKPNLYIVGAPKCGTTAMAVWLSQHPDIYVSAVKEPHYFGEEHRLTKTIEEYERLFSGVPEETRWVCEASVWYLFSETAIKNIVQYNPESKFIVMLRNPVDMALSMHEQHRFNGNELVEDFQEALGLSDIREGGNGVGVRSGYHPVQHMAYYKSCALGWQVSNMLKIVPKENVFFAFFDDLKADPARVHEMVLDFLGVEFESPENYEKVNPAKERRYYFLDRFVLFLVSLKKRLGIRKRVRLLSRLRRWNVSYKERKPIDQETRGSIQCRFSNDIDLLSSILGRDLSDWKR
ncbi:hypothetical protein D4A39_11905 [Alcanivorax profundi]|uniref:Sulfotransferase domain-containing protein n=1 Tax=Alcanivorax profundi TaxID=2338368 RepID=A0A418XX58_9GAMM|nr:sulfotransferase [Alcanivorax profundi]RJG17415.1 hypothetical protein D4A39_11905 [Alcanivorax profundi]